MLPLEILLSEILMQVIDEDMLQERNTEAFFEIGVTEVQLASDFWLFNLMEKSLMQQASSRGEYVFDDMANLLLKLFPDADKFHLNLFILYLF